MDQTHIIINELKKKNPIDNEGVGSILQRIRNERNGRVIALDIDNCSALGNDTNGILHTIALMTNNFELKRDNIRKIAKLLINPELLVAVKKIRQISEPFFVFYTMKSGIVDMICDLRLEAPYLEGKNNLAFRYGDPNTEGWDYIFNQMKKRNPSLDNKSHIHTQLCKVGIITACISDLLDLTYLAPVYITREKKNMDLIDNHLNLGGNKSFLYDDRAISHIHALGLDSYEKARMIHVQTFDFVTLSSNHRQFLYEGLCREFPMTEDFLERYPNILEEDHPHEIAVDPHTRNWKDLRNLKCMMMMIWAWDISSLNLLCV